MYCEQNMTESSVREKLYGWVWAWKAGWDGEGYLVREDESSLAKNKGAV